MIKLSMIIPFYNASDSLSRLLNSICKTRLNEVEVLLIDDGSDRRVLSAKDEGCLKDSMQITWFWKPHAGVSSARNFGLSCAQGEYVWLIDSDDLIAEHALEDALDCISRQKEPADIIWGNHIKASHASNSTELVQTAIDPNWICSCDTDEMLAGFYSREMQPVAGVWSNLYRLSTIEENHILFEESLQVYEDQDWLLRMLLHSTRFDSILRPIYIYYVDNAGSLINSPYTMEKHEGICRVIEKWFYYFLTQYKGAETQRVMLHYFLQQYRLTLSLIEKLPAAARRSALEQFQNSAVHDYYNKGAKKIEF